jgi:hypothetical protein
MVSWRSASAANLAFFKWFRVDQPSFCSPLQWLCADIGRRRSRSGAHKIFGARRRGSDAKNLRPSKSACAVDPDEKLEATEATGPPAQRKRPFNLRTADCRPKGRFVMESQISKIYVPSNAAGRQLPITDFAHKTRVVGDGRIGTVLAARDMAAELRRAAALDRRHHLQLLEAHMASIGLTPCRSMVAEDIRHLQSWTRHLPSA